MMESLPACFFGQDPARGRAAVGRKISVYTVGDEGT